MFRRVLGPRVGRPLAGQRWASPHLAAMVMSRSATYEHLVMRAESLISRPYLDAQNRERPHEKISRRMRATAAYGPFVQPDVEKRLVSEAVDKLEHIQQACAAAFPQAAALQQLLRLDWSGSAAAIGDAPN